MESRFSSRCSVILLILFYAGLGLTTLYSLRLFSLLASHQLQGVQLSCSCRLPLPVAAPLLFLFGLTLAQGSTLFAGSVALPLVVYSSDKLVV